MFDKEKQLQARIKLSQEILEFQKGKKDIFLLLSTGVGKNFNFLNISSTLNPKSILIVVPQSTMIDNVKADIKKLGFDYLLPVMEIICYASLKKYVGKRYEILVYDECHHLFSDTRMNIASQIQGEKRILLSATLDTDTQVKLSTEFELNKFECDYEDAVKRGILPELEIEIYSVSLDNIKAVYPHKFKDQKYETLLTASQYYKMLDNKCKAASDKWKDRAEFKGNPQWLYNRMLSVGRDRQAFLGVFKTDVLQQTITELGNERMIVFCASVDQANKLGGGRAVSSQNTPSVNRKIIESYNNREIDSIYSVNMLVEGANLTDTPYAIVTGLGNKELTVCQRIGRILRHDQPKMIVLVVAGTVDEKFLETSFRVNIYGERI